VNIAVIGAGSWGTTLASLLAGNGHAVRLWAREPEVAEEITRSRRNPYFLTDVLIHPKIKATVDPAVALDAAEIVVLAVPSRYVRSQVRAIKPWLRGSELLVNVAKGLEMESGWCLSQVILEELGIIPESEQDVVAVLSGPNLAQEVALGKPGASVVALPSPERGRLLQGAFSGPTFRVYRHTDRRGVELGGTLKNVFAIGAGLVEGLQLGDNAKAAYLTRSLHELVRLGVALGGNQATFYGLSGLGDLMATAFSPLSRNHRLGLAIAKRDRAQFEDRTSRMVVEGVETAGLARNWGQKLTISLPITEEICRVLFSDLSPEEAVANLMGRSLKDEQE
jgi:glycerol-3-phosphate dehydrogenase (NAD(P)+)